MAKRRGMNIIADGFSNLISLIQGNPTFFLIIFGLTLIVTIAALIVKREPLITMMLFTWAIVAVIVAPCFIVAARQI